MTQIQILKDVLVFIRSSINGRLKDVYVHPVNKIIPRGRFVDKVIPSKADVQNCERLLTAYIKATKYRKDLNLAIQEDVWTHIRRQQRTFFKVLETNDPKLLADYLCNMSMYDATNGTVQGEHEHFHIKWNPFYRVHIARMIRDKLLLLAEGVGALPCENPEQGKWGESVKFEISDLVSKIENTIGIKISPPAIDGGLFKVGTDSNQFSERDCNAIYTAFLMKNLLPIHQLNIADSPIKICEIGGGVGRVAYWSVRLGVKDFTIVDLPHINVLQGFYLMKSLPELDIRLYGEAAVDGLSEKKVTILPDFSCTEICKQSFDLIVNQDSFPEIHEEIVTNYLGWIKNNTNYFLSINHESKPRGAGVNFQNNVSNLIERTGFYLKLLRYPYWLRKGYVVELYKVMLNS